MRANSIYTSLHREGSVTRGQFWENLPFDIVPYQPTNLLKARVQIFLSSLIRPWESSCNAILFLPAQKPPYSYFSLKRTPRLSRSTFLLLFMPRHCHQTFTPDMHALLLLLSESEVSRGNSSLEGTYYITKIIQAIFNWYKTICISFKPFSWKSLHLASAAVSYIDVLNEQTFLPFFLCPCYEMHSVPVQLCW